jgi:hypothetical protein
VPTPDIVPEPGVYGFRIQGFSDPSLLASVPGSWVPLIVDVEIGKGPDDEPMWVGEEDAVIGLPGLGRLTMRREPMRLVITSPSPVDPDLVVHPVLSWAAFLTADWLARVVFHGGCFVARQGAWLVLGDREAGKSTLLAGLHERGFPVLADDVSVLDSGLVLAGPRRIDLRHDAAEQHDRYSRVKPVRRASRRGISLPAAAPSTPLCGVLALDWVDDDPVIEKVPPFDRVQQLGRFIRLSETSAGAILEISSFPMFRVLRPRSWGSSTAVLDAVEQTVR